MQFRGSEDRLNPIAPAGVDDHTLGGYTAVHGRAPGFEGADGCAYTAAVETEPADDDDDAWVGYIVFVRWAAEGSAIMGHVETGDLTRGASREEARAGVDALPLARVKEELDAALERKRLWELNGGMPSKDG